MKPGSLTPKQLGHLLDTIALIERIGESVKAHAIKVIHEGVDIPGYEACTTAPRRMWVDEDKANAVLEGMGLGKRERYTVDLLSPAQAEKMLRSKKLWPKKTRGGAGGDFTDPLKAVVGYTDTNPSIRKASKDS